MSLFGAYLGDMEDDPFFGSHMRTMRQMNNMMNSLFADPFGMMAPPDYSGTHNAIANHHRNSMNSISNMHNVHNSLMPYGMAGGGGFPMQNFNRLLSGSLDSLGDPGHTSFHSSSTVVSMTSGPDGRPQVYKASASTRTGPGGIKETQRTECDSRTGTKKMAIGHHIGERAHIIEREQNLRSGDREERQDFINLEEDDAEDFNKEWETKARSHSDIPRLAIGGGGGQQRPNRHSYGGQGQGYSNVPAITAGPGSSRRHRDRHSSSGAHNGAMVSPRRSIKSSPLALPASSMASNRSPYPIAHGQHVRKHKNMKTVSGPPSPPSPPANE